jgi:desumoylating isopeptidase 1
MIEPVFEELARAKTSKGKGGGDRVAFVKVDLSVGMSTMVASEHNVAATPTFGFFLDGKRVRLPSFFFGHARLRTRPALL